MKLLNKLAIVLALSSAAATASAYTVTEYPPNAKPMCASNAEKLVMPLVIQGDYELGGRHKFVVEKELGTEDPEIQGLRVRVDKIDSLGTYAVARLDYFYIAARFTTCAPVELNLRAVDEDPQ